MDNILSFDEHVTCTANKVNSRTHLIVKKSRFFLLKFRATLLKRFIQSTIDYYSTVHSLSNCSFIERLEACSIRRFLKVSVEKLQINQKLIRLRVFKLLNKGFKKLFQNCFTNLILYLVEIGLGAFDIPERPRHPS